MKRIITITFILIILLLSISCKKNEAIYSLSFDLDGGSVEGDLPNEFKLSDNYSLPNASKEDYLFVGWIDIDNEKDNYVVNKLETKNYNLKAWFVERFEYNDISENELFSQSEDDYYVYMHRDGCTWCNKIKDGVLAYLYKSSLPQFTDSKKVYTLNLSKSGNKASIFRTYDGEDGEGDGTFKVTSLTSIEEMYISSTPTLIEIKTIDGVKTALYVENGATKVLNKINEGLKSSDSFNNTKYTVVLNTNGGVLDGSDVIYFYNSEIVKLPSPKLEGYIFIGWADDSGIVENIKNRDYELSAIWAPDEEFIGYTHISEYDIFYQEEDSYYVYFYRDGCSWCEKINDRVKAYIYKTMLPNYSESKKVYIVNLTEGGVKASIFRTYKSDDSDSEFNVDGLTDISDMYIASTPTLIEINHKNGKAVSSLVTHGATSVIDAIEKELVYKESEEGSYNSFTIEYDLDGGEFTTEPITIFYPWQDVKLPTPYKEGYTFICWLDGEYGVYHLQAKNYELKAHYVKTHLPKELTVSNLYSAPDSYRYDLYFVCIIKDDVSYYDELLTYLTLFDSIYTQKIYYLDLGKEENKSIKRSYTGEGGQSDTGRFFVDGVTSVDDLYIPKACALIKIERSPLTYTSTYLASGEEVIQYIKTLLNR